MTEFIYLYRGGERAESPAEGQKQMQLWMAWMKELGEKGNLKAIGSPLEHAGIYQCVQAARQHVRRDAEALLELVEAREPVEGIPQDQDAPPLAYALERAGDRAWHFAEARPFHDGQFMGVTIMLQVTWRLDSGIT